MSRLVSPPNLITKVPKESRFRRVVVFGAGLSKAFGLPIATELLPECLAHSKRVGLNTGLIEEFVAAFYPASDADIEDLLGMAEAARHYGSLRASALRGNRWRPGRVNEMVDQLKRSVAGYFWQFQSDDLEARIDSLKAFVLELGGAGTGYISFNYDLLLESALEFAGIPYSYHMPAPENGVVVLKPHGSVNWYDSAPKGIATQEIGVGHARLLAANVFPNVGLPGNQPGFIIPPSPQKSIENEFLRKVWTSFSSLVTNTRTLSIVGYSMPTADRLARLVLRRAGAGFANTSVVSVVNPDKHARLHFERLVDPKICFVEQYFEDFVTTIAARGRLFAL